MQYKIPVTCRLQNVNYDISSSSDMKKTNTCLGFVSLVCAIVTNLNKLKLTILYAGVPNCGMHSTG
jgi:hypothetical protein